MKRVLTSLLILVSMTAACSSQEDDADGLGSGVGKSGPRKLVTSNLTRTSPVNLLIDPGFALPSQAYGSFIALSDEGQADRFTLSRDSRAPSGIGGSYATLKSSKTRMISTFLGGAGPFVAQVWVSTSDKDGKPTADAEDGKSIVASLATGLDDAQATELAPVPDQARKVGDRTWVLLRGESRRALPEGGYFIIKTGDKEGRFHFAAPEVTSKEVSVGMAVRGLTVGATSKVRPLEPTELRAIASYRKLTAAGLPTSDVPELPPAPALPAALR